MVFTLTMCLHAGVDQDASLGLVVFQYGRLQPFAVLYFCILNIGISWKRHRYNQVIYYLISAGLWQNVELSRVLQ